MRSRFRPVELLVGIGGSLAVLVVLLARPPWWEAAAIVLALTPLAIRLAPHVGAVDDPGSSDRPRVHERPLPRLGGIPIAQRWMEQWSWGVERTARDVKDEVQTQTQSESPPDTSPLPDAPPEPPPPATTR